MSSRPRTGRISFGLTLMLGAHGAIMIADTLIHERPTPQQLADIAVGAAAAARHLGHEPRVALLSHSTFGNPMHSTVQGIREAVAILDRRGVDFEYDGDMSPEVALDPAIRALYPFCRLTGQRQPAGDAGAALRPHQPRASRPGWGPPAPSGRCCWA